VGIKDSLKEDRRLFDDGRFLDEGKIFDGGFFWLKGVLLKGKELPKGNCSKGVGSLQGNGCCWLSANLRAKTLRKLKREH
jgi:hypothetical protein